MGHAGASAARIQRTILKVPGYRDAQVDRIERHVHLAALPPAHEAALVFARNLSHANPPPRCRRLRRARARRARPSGGRRDRVPAPATVAIGRDSVGSYATLGCPASDHRSSPPSTIATRKSAGHIAQQVTPMFGLHRLHRHDPAVEPMGIEPTTS